MRSKLCFQNAVIPLVCKSKPQTVWKFEVVNFQFTHIQDQATRNKESSSPFYFEVHTSLTTQTQSRKNKTLSFFHFERNKSGILFMHAFLSWPKVNQLTPIEIERRQNKNYGLKWTEDNWQLAYIVYGTFGNSSWHFCSIELSLKLEIYSVGCCLSFNWMQIFILFTGNIHTLARI